MIILPHINKGDFVWLDPTALGRNDSRQFNLQSSEFPAIAARVLSVWTDQQGGEHIILLDDQSNKLELGATEFQRWAIRPMHPTSIQGVSDLIQMVELHEAALLRNFQIRHRQNIYHTFIGNRILVSLNNLLEDGLPTDENQRKQLIRSYRQRPPHELLPHIYAFGAEILRFVKNGKNNCCVVFSGETASGKSESFKQLLTFLSADFANQNFETKLHSAQLIIEAFTNAKTSRNINASRHGKYLELNYTFNNEISQIIIASAKFELFFLEKHRVVEAFVEQSGESNFHIFYCLLAGLSPQQKLDFELTNGRISSYRLLAQYRRNSRDQNNYFINGETTSWMFGGERIRPSFELLSKVVGAFRNLNFTENEIENIWRLLAVILHLGNLRYNVKNYDGKENLELNDRLNIQRICKLLKVEKNLLISSLTIKSLFNLKSEEELNLRKLTIDEAIDRRDSLCTEIYLNIVNYIINKINIELNEENKIINWRKGQQQKFVSVGLVDFQGIENKMKNGNNFEQLCINYGAECLQQFFIRRIFTLEQAEYAAQCLPEWEEKCATLPYLDNLQVLEMLAVQPLSVMSVIDDISIVPEATDINLLSKLHLSHSNNESLYQRPKSSLLDQFAIRHYTGLVQYKVEGMLLKNKDYFPTELQKLINESELKFLQKIFQNNEEEEISNEFCDENELKENENNEFKIKRIKQNTQCTIIRRSMNDLMRRLENCPEAFFVRCLKTNDAQKEKLFETETVLRQMRQFDMLSTVAMCRAGFPIHMEYSYFVRRYRPLMPGIPPPNFCDCAHTTGFICRTIFGDSCTEFVQFGKSKAFLKSEQHQFLEMLRSRRLHCCAALVQKCLLGWAKRQQYAKLRWATLIFQKHWRGLVERKKFKIIIRGVTRLQAVIRSHQLVIRYQWLRSTIAHFQANCRAALIRHQLQCLVTRAERHCAMMARLECQMENEGEPPALELHENELNNIIKEKNFGSLKISKYINEKMEDLNKNIKEKRICNNKDDSFRWAKFALANFQQTKCTPKHTRILLERSLLSHQKPLDELVAMSVWRRLLQLIGDSDASDCAAYEGRNSKNVYNKNSLPIMAKLKALYCQDFSDDEINYIKAHLLNYQTYQENGHILKKSIKIAKNILLGESNWTAFEKAKFIVSVGIYRNELRDEIYSQICKQINCNPSSISARRGWILMALCSSAFSPTNRLIPYLRNFVNSNAPNILWQLYIAKQMSRTIKYGPRREPCLKAEFASVCSIDNLNNSGLFVQINLPNEEIVDIPIHSQTTIADVFQLLIEKINLNEFFGFGLFLSNGQNIRSLVVGKEYLMDALSLIEEKGNFDWKLYLRKELFLPSENNSDDLCVDLSYRQIIKGINFGEYKCKKEEDLAILAAQQYFISLNGKSTEIDISELEDNLNDYLPLNILKQNKDDNKSLKITEEIEEECQKWIQLILHAFRKKILNNCETPPPSVKQIKCDVIKYAAKNWPLHFSRFFEVYKFSGPPLPVNQLTMAVNSHGISLLDARCDIQNQNKQSILFEIEFIELANIGYGRSKHEGADALFISLLNGDRYTFQSPLARELSHLLINILKDLHQHSIYAIALKDYNHCTVQHKMQSSENSVLSLSRGDLLILSSPLNKYLNNNEIENNEENYFIENVENIRSKMRGKVPLHSINILACTEKPKKEKLNFLLSSRKIIEQEIINPTESKPNSDLYEYPTFYTAAIDPFGIPLICGPFPQPHTLERFASTNFRLPEDGIRPSDVFGAYNGGGCPEPELWRHSFEPLRAPLLKRIAEPGKEEIARESLISYSFILKYMGDYVSHPQQFYLEYTDYIFTPSLKYEILRDEIYCQLIKQLTDNQNPLSEERGWELMWLCIGLFPPSRFLCREVEHFLRTRLVPMAADCAMRLQKALSQCNDTNNLTTTTQYCRLSPPHQVELEAIQYRQTQIYHKFYLPDGTQETIEVESWTRAKDFSKKIATRLGLLNSLQGFGLFIKLGEKVVCMPEKEYFFDFINQVQDWARKNSRREQVINGGKRILNCGINFNYQVHFMRKLWLDVEPGKDLRQDIIFNYPQELPKYLRGYHKIDKNEAIQFAALILRAQTRDEKQPPIQHLQHILHELLPIDLLKSHSPNEWKKFISFELQKEGMPKTSTEAKLCFLQRISKEPTFGSAFFEVKQSADPTLCSKLLVAINQDGMSLYELENKKHIRTYGFKQISNWQSANTYFHLTFDNGNRLLFETTLGHKLDDLLTSYIQLLISKQEKENEKQKISPLSKIAVLLHQYKPNNYIESTSPILTNGN